MCKISRQKKYKKIKKIIKKLLINFLIYYILNITSRAVAQLVARLVWDQDVAGSNPVCPIHNTFSFEKVFFFNKKSARVSGQTHVKTLSNKITESVKF